MTEKKKYVKPVIKEVKWNLLEGFKNHLKTKRKRIDVIDYLDFAADLYSRYDYENLTREQKEGIEEFADYFMEHCYSLVEDDIRAIWGEELPFILQLAEKVKYEFYREEIKEAILELPAKTIKKAEVLVNKILTIPKDKHLTFILPSMAGVTTECDISERLSDAEMEDLKEEFLHMCANVLDEEGTIIVHTNKDYIIEVFGFWATENTEWMSIPAHIIQSMENVVDEEIELEPEENVIYTEVKLED